jgi:hypothetical protein
MCQVPPPRGRCFGSGISDATPGGPLTQSSSRPKNGSTVLAGGLVKSAARMRRTMLRPVSRSHRPRVMRRTTGSFVNVCTRTRLTGAMLVVVPLPA